MKSTYWITREIILRLVAGIYLVTFISLFQQGRGLWGDMGILPLGKYVEYILGNGSPWPIFWKFPSLFWFFPSEKGIPLFGLIGSAISLFLIVYPHQRILWLINWLIYLSFIHIGQIFMGYGWEILMVEAGLLMAFYAAPHWIKRSLPQDEPPFPFIYLLRWLCFRIILGAGLIKLRSFDSCWVDLTCLNYHFQTQPNPHPLSLLFHQLPGPILKLGVIINHICELVLPFCFFMGRRLQIISGLLSIGFQLAIIASGNLSWLNWITLILLFSCFDDRFWQRCFKIKWTPPPASKIKPVELLKKNPLRTLFVLLIVFKSYAPLKNLFLEKQRMNASYDGFHLVNSYGAFGSITKKRYEIDIRVQSENGQWSSLTFKCKPGKLERTPCLITPYHLRLDWQMWFQAMGPPTVRPWFFSFIRRLLENSPHVVELLDPESKKLFPIKKITADLYDYQFDSLKTPWKRTFIGPYISPIDLTSPELTRFLKHHKLL